jgi:hypothetical protein
MEHMYIHMYVYQKYCMKFKSCVQFLILVRNFSNAICCLTRVKIDGLQ